MTTQAFLYKQDDVLKVPAMKITYLIVPAMTDQAGQCRIVARKHLDDHIFKPSALDNYRNDPDAWYEAGLMDSRGKVVCLDDAVFADDMKLDEPLRAGLVYTYDEETKLPA